jgi:hypothetical protein
VTGPMSYRFLYNMISAVFFFFISYEELYSIIDNVRFFINIIKKIIYFHTKHIINTFVIKVCQMGWQIVGSSFDRPIYLF